MANLAQVIQLLKEQQETIIEIVSKHPSLAYYYKGRTVRIFGCEYTRKRIPAVEVLPNFDERDQYDVDIVICWRKHPSRPPNPKHRHSFAPDMMMSDELYDRLNCIANVVKEDGLEYYYPKTYRKTLATDR
jgi:hypothetical protein